MKRTSVLAASLALLSAPALAERQTFSIANQTYRSECGSCHVAYPPALLPKESWRAIMAGLDEHFGSDASLDAKTAKEIEAYLLANAARNAAPSGKAPLRISETSWFRREHGEVPVATWKSGTVKSAANCSACHPRAEQGDFSERNVRLPK